MAQARMNGLALAGVLGGAIMATTVNADLVQAVELNDHTALVQAIANGAEIDARNSEGQTALLVAVWANDIEAARLLIAAGADVNDKDALQDSRYLVAGAHGRNEILTMILQNGADLGSVNRFGGTAIIPAAEKGHPETVSLLIAAGVDVNHVNDLGWTALMEAVVLSDGGPLHQDIVKRLLEGGADRSIPDKDGVTALEHAKQRGFTEMVALLER